MDDQEFVTHILHLLLDARESLHRARDENRILLQANTASSNQLTHFQQMLELLTDPFELYISLVRRATHCIDMSGNWRAYLMIPIEENLSFDVLATDPYHLRRDCKVITVDQLPYKTKVAELLSGDTKQPIIGEPVTGGSPSIYHPLADDKGLVAILHIEASSPTSQIPPNSLENLAQHIPPIDTARALRFSLIANNDPLTSVATLTYFRKKVHAEIERARKQKHTFALIYCDIDNFKEVNEQYGHPAGDQAIVQFAKVLEDGRKENDLVGRVGGDEFMVFCADCDHNEALDRAEHYRRRIETKFKEEGPQLTIEGRRVTVTTSIGFATFPENGQTYNDLYGAADKAQQHIKHSSKNGVWPDRKDE